MEANVIVSANLGNYEIDCTVLVGSDDSIKEQIFEQLKEENPEMDEEDSDLIIWEVIDWEDLSDYENLQKIDLFEEIADYSGNYDLDVLSAAVECDVQFSDINEAYNGEYKDDADFAENICEQIGAIPSDLPSYIHIDWDWTAREIMMDYSEANGHYFRNF
jgi:antirestriction protein